MRAAPAGLEQAMDRMCSSCTRRAGCPIEGAARVFWPEHQRFPAEWTHDAAWRCSNYQAPRLAGTGLISDPGQVEMFAAEAAHG